MAIRGVSANGTLAYGSIGQVRVREVRSAATLEGPPPTPEAELGPMSDTLVAPLSPASEHRVRAAAVAALPAAARMTRTTVLPRIELGEDGDGPVLVPQAKPRYRQVARLGEGGLGEVMLALDEDIGRSVAIKRLHDEGDRAQLMRFVDEVRLTGRLDHPNIVPLHDVGCDEGGRLYFVMKRVEGETLEAIVERLRDGDAATHRRYPIEVRVEIFLGVLRAIEFAHAQRIVHRDIKPSNIMIGRFGEVVVMDWGIAKRLDDELGDALDAAAPRSEEPADGIAGRRNFRTRVGTLLGTPAYMSPEQARGDNHLVDELSDVYSASVVLYELLTLEHYLGDLDQLHAILDAVRHREPARAMAVHSPHQRAISAELSRFLERGMAKQRDARYGSVGEMIEALHRVTSGTFPISCPGTLLKRGHAALGHVIDEHPRVALSVLLCGLAGALGGAAALALHMFG